MGGVHARGRREPGVAAPAREALENLASILDNWQPLVALYEKALSAKGKEKLPSALERELLLVVAVAYDEKLEKSEKAVEYFRRAQSIQPEDASALVALERLYTRTERWSDLVDTLLQEGAAGHRPRRARGDPHPHRHRVGGDAGQRRGGDRRLERRPPGQPGNVQALRALDRLYLTRGEYRELADNLQRQLKLSPTIPPRRSRCSGASARCASSSSGSWAPRSTPTRRSSRSSPSTAETIAALERILPSPEHELDVAHAPGADLQDPRRLAAPDRRVRDQGAPRRRSRSRRSSCYKQIAEGYEIGLDDPAHAYEALGRALRRGSAEPRGADERSSGWPARSTSWTTWSRRYGRLVAVGRRSGAQERALSQDRAPRRGRTWATTRRRPPPTPRRWTSRRATSRRPTRSSSSTCAAPTTTNLVELLLRKAEIVDDVAEKKALYFRAAQIYEEVLEDLESAIDVFQHVLSVDDGDTAALDELERLYIRLARWNDLKDVYARRRSWPPTPGEKKQMLFVLGQVYDRELGDPERAIETYSSILDLDPEDYDAAQALDRLYQQPGAGTTCSRSSSARPSWRRRPPRSCRCATASASCGAST